MQTLRDWATPLTVGAFLLSAVTGVMMFFRLNTGLSTPVHEWFGWFLIIGASLHAFVHWPSFKSYFSKPIGATVISVFAAVTLLSFVPFQNSSHEPPFIKASNALVNSPLALVAQVARQDEAALLNKLKESGLSVNHQQQTIREIAKLNDTREMQLLEIIFDK